MTSALAELLTPAGMALLDSLPEYSDESSLRLATALRRDGHSPELVAEVLTQSRLRQKARDKFGDFAERMLFTQHGLEQATRLAIAAHPAARFRRAGVETVADLGCGLGGDTIAKAGLGLSVIGVDLDPTTVAFATVNTSVFPDVTIELGAVEDFDLSRVDGAWFDPARREDVRGKAARVHDPELASPPLSAIVAAAERLGSPDSAVGAGRVGAVGAKMAPAISHDALPAGTETQWVSYGGQLLEACVWFGPLVRRTDAGSLISRSALVLGKQADAAPATQLLPDTDDDDALRNPEVGDLEDYVLEPDSAVFRAGLLGTLARQIGAHTIDPSIAYLSAARAESSPLARAFRVREVLPLHQKQLAQYMKKHRIGTLEIKKRGVDVDPAQLRRSLRLDAKAKGSATLLLTRRATAGGEERIAILADPV